MARTPKVKVSITERDLGLGHLLKEAAKLAKKPYVKAGVTQARGSRIRADGKKTVADIMAIHEYGAPDAGIPERSVIRATQERNQSKYDAHIAILGEKILDASSHMTTEKALGLIGQEFVADAKNTIRNNEAGLNGPTPLKSRDGTPLLDTGQTINSMGHEVVMDGRGAEE